MKLSTYFGKLIRSDCVREWNEEIISCGDMKIVNRWLSITAYQPMTENDISDIASDSEAFDNAYAIYNELNHCFENEYIY